MIFFLSEDHSCYFKVTSIELPFDLIYSLNKKILETPFVLVF